MSQPIAVLATHLVHSFSFPFHRTSWAGSFFLEAPPESRPNIVLVVLDDFSMDLLQTLRSARTMRETAASDPHSYVVDSLCCVSRASTFTGQSPTRRACAPTWPIPVTRPTREAATPRSRSSATARAVSRCVFSAPATRRGTSGGTSTSTRTTPAARRRPSRLIGQTFGAVFGSAYDGREFYSSLLQDGRLRLRHHPAPPAQASATAKDAAYAGTVIEENALEFIAAHAGDQEPYFLEVAPYAPHSRVNAKPHYDGDPLFPPAFRDRPQPGLPGGNCGAVECTALTVRDLPGYARPRYAADLEMLTRMLDEFDDCSAATRNDPVRGECRRLAEGAHQ